jgi:adenylylsulfate reductase, subunit A
VGEEPLYEVDVLILGTGASGVGAALQAAKQKADVLMVGKGRLESSGSLGGGNDHFMAVLDTDEPHDNQEAFVGFFMKSAFGMNSPRRKQRGIKQHAGGSSETPQGAGN